jgi:hypothetical protein
MSRSATGAPRPVVETPSPKPTWEITVTWSVARPVPGVPNPPPFMANPFSPQCAPVSTTLGILTRLSGFGKKGHHSIKDRQRPSTQLTQQVLDLTESDKMYRQCSMTDFATRGCYRESDKTTQVALHKGNILRAFL